MNEHINENDLKIEKKKKQLRRYRKNRECLNRLYEKLDFIKIKMINPRAFKVSGMPKGGTPVTMGDLLIEKEELENRIVELKAKGSIIRKEILKEIDTLDDYRYCEILEGYFIDGKSLEDIAYAEGYTLRHVYRLYKRGVELLTLNGHKDDI